MKSSTAGVRLRRMTESDLEQLMAIAASLRDAPHWPATAYLAVLKLDSTPRRIALVAEQQVNGESQNNRILGFLIAVLIPPQAELETIAVSVVAQRRGIGRRLFFAMDQELRTAGVSEVLLEVRASNRPALCFYRSLGWSETSRRPRYYADPEEDAVLMSLKLE